MGKIGGYLKDNIKEAFRDVEVTLLHSLKVALTENTPENPLPVNNIDAMGRAGTNSLMGDTVTATRHITIATQFQYGIEDGTAVPEIIGSGAITFDENILKINSGVDINGKAAIESFETVRYVPGTEVFGGFTLFFENCVENSIARGGLYDAQNGFFIECRGDEYYFVRRRLAVDFEEKMDIAAFNEREGYELDLTKGNIFRISFIYFGFGPILLEVERPDGRNVLLHRIEYPNKHTQTHIAQTYLPMRAEVFNVGNNSDVGIGIGSIAAGIINGQSADAAKRTFTYENDTVFTVSGNTTLVAFRNKDVFNLIANRIVARLIQISGANDLNKNCRWRLFKNPTFLNVPTWTDVNTNNSVLEYSEDALVDFALSSDVFLSWNTAKIANFLENVSGLELDLPPNGVAAFAIETSLGSGEADLSILWDELF